MLRSNEQGRSKTQGPVRPKRPRGIYDEWGGWAWAAGKILGPLLPPRGRLKTLVRLLLENREGVGASPTRAEALSVLWELASNAARFGALDVKEIADGCTPFFIPPIPSDRLVEWGVITASEAVWQIRMRKIGREQRGKGPPENRIIVKAASSQESEKLGLQSLTSKKPVLLIEEYYTLALPRAQIRNAELDRIGVYALYREGETPQLLFLGETQVPHAHFSLQQRGSPEAQRWFRVDISTHPDFEIPFSISPPQARTVEEPTPALNEQIAALLVLFVEGTRQAMG